MANREVNPGAIEQIKVDPTLIEAAMCGLLNSVIVRPAITKVTIGLTDRTLRRTKGVRGDSILR